MNKSTSLNTFLNLVSDETSTFINDVEQGLINETWLNRSFEIALAVLSAMKKVAMTQRQLADLMQVSPQYINKVLRGKENLTLETISRLEQALDISLMQVIKYQEENNIIIFGENEVHSLTVSYKSPEFNSVLNGSVDNGTVFNFSCKVLING